MSVSIKLMGEGLDFTGEVTLFQAAQIMAAIAKPDEVSGESLPAPTQKPPVLGEVVGGSEYDSPRQAIDALKANTNPKKIVAIALYLGATSQNGKTLTTDDVIAEFAKAGEPTPTHIARDMKKAVTAGHIYFENKNEFRLLAKTDSIPESGFTSVKQKGSSSSPKPTGKSAPKPTVRSEIATMPIITTLDGHKDYFSITKRSDQILWILKYAQSVAPNGLNRAEITYLSSQIGGDITSRIFSSTNASNVKNGFISSTGMVIALTAKGEKYMKEEIADIKK